MGKSEKLASIQAVLTAVTLGGSQKDQK